MADITDVEWTAEIYDRDELTWERASITAVTESEANGGEGDKGFTLTATVDELVDVRLPLSVDVRLISRESGPEDLYARVTEALRSCSATPDPHLNSPGGAHSGGGSPSSTSIEPDPKPESQADDLSTTSKPDVTMAKPMVDHKPSKRREARDVNASAGMAAREGDLAQLKAMTADFVPKKLRTVLNSRGWNGKTPLYWASTYGHTAVMEWLIANGAKVNAKCNGGYTALMGASYAGQVDAVRMLMEKGASRFRTDNAGNTAVNHATRNNPITKGSSELRKELKGLVGFTFGQKLRSQVCIVS